MDAVVMYIDSLRPQEADTEGRSKLKDRVVYTFTAVKVT